MSIATVDEHKRKRVAGEYVAILDDKKRKRYAYIMLMKAGNRIYVLWEKIYSFIFSFDGFGLQTKDGYIIKCKDQ